MNTQICIYVAIYNGRKITIHTTSLWAAVEKARTLLKVPKSKQGLLSVLLVAVDGREVEQVIT